MLVLLGIGDVGGVIMTVAPARCAPSRVRLDKSLGSSLGLDGPFLVPVLRLWSVVDQTMGACPLDCVVPGWFWTGAPLSAKEPLGQPNPSGLVLCCVVVCG